MDTQQSISTREMGAIPISIGTSLAIESVLGILPEHETDNPQINHADCIWINIRTLYRNIMGAVDKDIKHLITEEDLILAIKNEMQTIEATVNYQTKARVSVVFYVCRFVSLQRRFPHALHRVPNTPLQKQAFDLEQHTVKGLIDEHPPHDFRVFDLDFDAGNPRTFIITHYPIDLLNRYKFQQLTLLESHTGTLKPPARWSTKFYDGKTAFNIPFDRAMLQLFGDGVLFSPMNIKIRRHIQELASKHKWSAVTTREYIVKSIKMERDPILEGFIMKLY